MGELVIKKKKQPSSLKQRTSSGSLAKRGTPEENVGDAGVELVTIAPVDEQLQEQSTEQSTDKEQVPSKPKPPKRVPPGTLKLQVAGSLVLVKNPLKELSHLAKRFEVLFESLANMEPPERILIYKMINGLMLTSIAKKTKDNAERRRLFDLKNELFYNLANDRDSRRKLAFMYMTSKNFRIVEFCPTCTASNTEQNLKRYEWKHCKECKIDHNFYNVLSMHHKFKGGSTTLFLSHDLLHKIPWIQLNKKGQLENVTEEATFNRYHYGVQNLDSFELNSVLEWNKKLLALKS